MAPNDLAIMIVDLVLRHTPCAAALLGGFPLALSKLVADTNENRPWRCKHCFVLRSSVFIFKHFVCIR